MQYGLNLNLLNNELSKMIGLGNSLYFRKRRYTYTADKGRTYNVHFGTQGNSQHEGKFFEYTGGGVAHVIVVPVAPGEIVKLTPLVIDPNVSVMTWYRNNVEQVFVAKGNRSIDWLIEVYQASPAKSTYGLELYAEDGRVLWNSSAPTLFPILVASPMYFDADDFEWGNIESFGRSEKFSRCGMVFDPSQNAIMKGADGTSGMAMLFTLALGCRWIDDFRLSKDFMIVSVGHNPSVNKNAFSVDSYNMYKDFSKHSSAGWVRIYRDVDSYDWFTQQVATFNGEKWNSHNTDTGANSSGVYKPENSVFYGRSAGILCYTDI